jgi:hypothetical protein
VPPPDLVGLGKVRALINCRFGCYAATRGNAASSLSLIELSVEDRFGGRASGIQFVHCTRAWLTRNATVMNLINLLI